jgi:hypothetical protein
MKLSLAFLSLLCAGVLAAPVPQAAAAAAFDGRWSVTIVPTSGECSARRTVPIQVSNGRITYDGSFRAQAKGKVSPKGAIDVTFARKGDVANATGSLARSSGRGRWTSPTKDCAGTWSARRA